MKAVGVTFAVLREIALALPGVVEGTSYGTPAFRVGKKFLARMKEDGETLVVRIGFDEREALMQAEPAIFFITEHYRGYPAVLVRLAKIDPDSLREVLLEAWRNHAPKKLLAEFDRRPA
jgi:hypothetical protein